MRLSRGLRATADHIIEVLIEELPGDDPWRSKLAALEPLSSFATAYRYPSPTGKRKSGPSNTEVLEWVKTIAELSAQARAALVTPAGSTG